MPASPDPAERHESHLAAPMPQQPPAVVLKIVRTARCRLLAASPRSIAHDEFRCKARASHLTRTPFVWSAAQPSAHRYRADGTGVCMFSCRFHMHESWWKRAG